MRIATRLLAGVVLFLSACATAGGAGGERDERRSDTILRDEIEETHASNAYDVVRTLRPGWLRSRGPTSIYFDGDIVVYLDQSRLGGPDELRTIDAESIASLRFFDAKAAQQRFGMDHTQGAIQVVTRRGPI